MFFLRRFKKFLWRNFYGEKQVYYNSPNPNNLIKINIILRRKDN